MRSVVLAGLVVLSGCIDHQPRPARTRLGYTTRHFAGSTPLPASTAARTTQPMAPTGEAVATGLAQVGTFQFTMAMPFHTYGGLDLEAGTLAKSGSNLASVSGVVGAQAQSTFGELGVELAGGWRTMRADPNGENTDSAMYETRVRGELFVDSQVTLGGVMGTSLGGAWMAGVYLGIHSNDFDRWGR